MKKHLKKAKKSYDMVSEDLKILQRMITKQSVYAKARVYSYERKPKHSKSYMDYLEI